MNRRQFIGSTAAVSLAAAASLAKAHDHAGHSHSAFILVCTKCGAVDEQSLSKQWEELQRALGDTGFEMTEEHLVLTGVCAKCH